MVLLQYPFELSTVEAIRVPPRQLDQLKFARPLNGPSATMDRLAQCRSSFFETLNGGGAIEYIFRGQGLKALQATPHTALRNSASLALSRPSQSIMRKRTSDESRPGVSSRSCSDRHSIAPDRRYPQGLADSQFAGMAIGDRCLPVLARSSRRSSADVVRWAYRSPVCCSTRPLRARSALRRASRRSDLGSSHRSIRRPRRQRGACRLDESSRQRRPSRKSGARTARLRTLLDIFYFNPKLACMARCGSISSTSMILLASLLSCICPAFFVVMPLRDP